MKDIQIEQQSSENYQDHHIELKEKYYNLMNVSDLNIFKSEWNTKGDFFVKFSLYDNTNNSIASTVTYPLK